MKITYGLENRSIKPPLYLALGNFDGVHRGHQAVIRGAVRRARDRGGSAAALLFDPHPAVLLHPQKKFCLLTQIDDRAALMEKLGLHYLFVAPFTPAIAATTADKFIREILLEKIKIDGLFVGVDYSFGRGGAGTEELLRQQGDELGFSVTVSPMEEDGGVVISSSSIKKLLEEGAVDRAAALLNYYFFRRGRVVSGRGRGKKMLFPTANLDPGSGLAWPGSGVYLTVVGGLEEQIHFGVTNVGIKPTFGDRALSIETHIIDFGGEIYGREITLYFLERLRDTENFPSPEHLRSQIEKDIARSRRLARSRFGGIGGFVEPVRLINPLSPAPGASADQFYFYD